MDRCSELDPQVRANHREQIITRMPLGHAQVSFRWPEGIEPFQLTIDQHCGGCIRFDDKPTGTLDERDLAGRRLGLWKACRQPCALGVSKQKASLAGSRAPDVPINAIRLRDDLEAALGTAD